MGWNSTIIVLNDALGQIEEDKEFGKKVGQAIRELSIKKGRVDISSGNHCNAASVVETHHADSTAILAVGGNFATEIGHCWGSNHHKLLEQKRMLEEALEQVNEKLERESSSV